MPTNKLFPGMDRIKELVELSKKNKALKTPTTEPIIPTNNEPSLKPLIDNLNNEIISLKLQLKYLEEKYVTLSNDLDDLTNSTDNIEE